jgi:CRP/FNR family transcriptional regulator, cyclic AMP receptor protein
MAVTFPLYELLPEDERQRQICRLKMEKYHAGQIIHDRGGDCFDAFFIFEGRVRIDSSTAEGESVFFWYRRPGAMLGWWAAVGEKPQPVTATAADEVLLGRLKQAEFMDLVLSRRETSAWMLKFATQQLLGEVDRIRCLMIMGARRRVAAELVGYASDSGSDVVEAPERIDLASRLGMTRETLSRILSELQKEGLIKVDGKKIRILDMHHLIESTW